MIAPALTGRIIAQGRALVLAIGALGLAARWPVHRDLTATAPTTWPHPAPWSPLLATPRYEPLSTAPDLGADAWATALATTTYGTPPGFSFAGHPKAGIWRSRASVKPASSPPYCSRSLFSQYLIFFSRYVNRIVLRFEVIRNAPLTAIPGTTD